MAMDPLSIGNESPPARQSILGSFLRSRPRGTSQSHPSPPHNDVLNRDSPSPSSTPADNNSPANTNTNNTNTNNANVANSNSGHRRRPAAVSPNLTSSHSTHHPASSTVAGLSQMLRRRRSAGALASSTTPQVPAIAVARTAIGAPSAPTVNRTTNNTTTSTTNNNNIINATPSINNNNSNGNNIHTNSNPNALSHRIRLVPHLDSRRSLRFDPIIRDVREGDSPLRIGRFTDRTGLGLAAANAMGSNKLAFKSKVVSRAHAEIWVESGGRFFIKDTKSSSGTFLNHVRLSPANTESVQKELRDGDLLQLGVDYQGGAEDIYKCVKIKVEVGREWQAHSNPFNANALKQLKAIAIPSSTNTAKKTISSKTALPDCCICLFGVTINQALFIAPCSHAFHYKCIRPLLENHHPAFSCPLCRTFANLDEDVEVELDTSELLDEGLVESEGVGEVSEVIAAVAVAAGLDSVQASTALPGQSTNQNGGVMQSGQQPLPPLPNGSSHPRSHSQGRPRSAGHDTRDRDRERERERERHPDAGAETEVEPDSGGLGRFRGINSFRGFLGAGTTATTTAGGGKTGGGVTAPPLPISNGVSMGGAEDVDAEMEDLAGGGGDGEVGVGVGEEEGGGMGMAVVVEREEEGEDEEEQQRDGDPFYASNSQSGFRMGMGRSNECLVEGEDDGSAGQEEGGVEGGFHGSKRKR